MPQEVATAASHSGSCGAPAEGASHWPYTGKAGRLWLVPRNESSLQGGRVYVATGGVFRQVPSGGGQLLGPSPGGHPGLCTPVTTMGPHSRPSYSGSGRPVGLARTTHDVQIEMSCPWISASMGLGWEGAQL